MMKQSKSQFPFTLSRRGILGWVDWIVALLPISKKPLPQSIKKILLIKGDHLGDALLFTTMLPILKKYYPNTQIDMLCGRGAQVIYQHNPHLSNIFVADHLQLNRSGSLWSRLKKAYKDYGAAWKILKKQQYDVCICVRPYPGHFMVLGRLIKSRCLIGYGKATFGNLCDIAVDWKTAVHEVDHYFEVLAPLGIPAFPYHTLKSELYPAVAEEEAVAQKLALHQLQVGNFCAICPTSGAANKVKVVTPLLWQQLIAKKLTRYPYVVITGVKKNFFGFEQVFDLLSEEQKSRLIDFSDQLSVPQLYLLLAQAAEMVSIDSLSAHLASMLAIPAVVFFGYSQGHNLLDSEQQFQQFRPLRADITCVIGQSAIADYIQRIDETC